MVLSTAISDIPWGESLKNKAFLGAFLALLTMPAMACELPRAVKINIVPVTEEVEFDYSQTLADIQGQAAGAHNPFGFHTPTYTQGFMLGDIMMEPSVKLGGYTQPSKGTSCLWFDTININVKIDPKIVMAKEVYEDECTRKSIYKHEMKHVKADRAMVNEFSHILGDKIYKELKSKGLVAGPFPSSEKDIVTKKMQDTVFALVKDEYKWMAEERGRAQASIDNIEEYERVSAECPVAQKRLERAYRR